MPGQCQNVKGAGHSPQGGEAGNRSADERRQ